MPLGLVLSILLDSRLTHRVPTRMIELNRYHNHGGDHAEPCTPDGVFALSQLAPSHGARQGGKRLFIRLVLTLTIVTISLHPAWARLQEGYDAVSRGDKEQALQELRTRAEGGNARAQVVIGILYAEGRGVPKDEQESVRWYKLAAAQGEAKAQRRVGYHYAVGRGAPQDYKEAVRWYRLAAEQGDADAQYNMGYLYDSGQGVPQDFKEARRVV